MPSLALQRYGFWLSTPRRAFMPGYTSSCCTRKKSIPLSQGFLHRNVFHRVLPQGLIPAPLLVQARFFYSTKRSSHRLRVVVSQLRAASRLQAQVPHSAPFHAFPAPNGCRGLCRLLPPGSFPSAPPPDRSLALPSPAAPAYQPVRRTPPPCSLRQLLAPFPPNHNSRHAPRPP